MDAPSIACSCHQNGGKKIHNYFVLETMLPVEYSYLICTFNESANHSITSRFHLNCFTKDEALEWLDKCSSITNITFTTEKKDDIIYARCCCTLSENRCRTVLKINLNPINATSKNSSTEHNILHEHPTTVNLHYTHDLDAIANMLIEEVPADSVDDDSLDSTEIQTRTKPKSIFLDDIMHQKLSYLFDIGKSPERTYKMYKDEIQSVFDRFNTDNTQQPDLKWVEEQFYVYFERKHGIQFKEALLRWKKQSEEQSAQQQSAPDTQPNVLDTKIDELCKKYKPILPACKREPKIAIPSSTPQKVINSFKTSPISDTPSYVINFNSEKPKLEKLTAIPVKLIPSDIVVQSPDMKILPSTKDNQVLKMIGINDSIPQNITIPPIVNGIYILANTQPQLSFKQSNTNASILRVLSSEKSSPSVPIPRKRKRSRKSNLKCEDSDDIIFTDRIEDLQLHAKSNSKENEQKSSDSASKTKNFVSKNARQLREKSTSKKIKQKSARTSRKERKSRLKNTSTIDKSKKKKIWWKNSHKSTTDKNEKKTCKKIPLKNTPIVDSDAIENVVCSD